MNRWLVHREVPSPNWNARKLPVSMLVLHYTGMPTAQEALDRMCDPAAEVSAHYMIDEGGTVSRLVAEDKRAWHAGRSYWRGITDINSASVGI
jgi:N-acetylmuramoyl-L-alanine amidase